MASSNLVRAAFFAVGAIVGGGVATAIGAGRRKEVIQPPPPPIVDVQPTGVARITAPGALTRVDLPVLKYGNPGELVQ